MLMIGDYLHRNGYTYMAFGWNKRVTDFFGDNPPRRQDRALAYGTIERGSDGNEILKDAARIIRDIQPWKRFAVSTVLGVGHSQTGMRLSGFARAGHNQADGELLYDGFLTSGQGGRCSQMTDVEPALHLSAPCFGPTPADQGKVIVVQMETDLPFFRGGTVRAETSTYRVYEFAGISHIPAPYFPLAGEFNATRQNPADMAPGYRAAIANLVSWVVDGVEPPASVYLEGTVAADGTGNARARRRRQCARRSAHAAHAAGHQRKARWRAARRIQRHRASGARSVRSVRGLRRLLRAVQRGGAEGPLRHPRRVRQSRQAQRPGAG